MLKQEDKEKIEQYINGQFTTKGKSYIETLFLNGEENNDLKYLLKKDWDSLINDNTASEVDLDFLLDRVHHLIRKNETIKRLKPYQKVVRLYMKTAAIVLMPVLIAGGLVFKYMSNNGKNITGINVTSTIYAPLGARVAFNLPDSTSGMLNSGSHLTYSLPFSNNRKVKLDGEAWFEVHHDENHPFEISTGTSNVKVLGTSFNMSAYPAENYVEVVLQRGKVEFQNKINDEKVTMLPSERLVFQNGNISKSLTDPSKYNAWTEGKLVFRGDPMAEVAKRIERWYNVTIILADQGLEKYSFRATFLDDSLAEVLRCLSLTSPIKYYITPGELLRDGTYKKEVVTIYLK